MATVAGLYEYLIIRGDTAVARNPVPRGLALRRPGRRAVRGVPLIRAPRTLPRVIDPDEVDSFVDALRTRRDRAMVEAMLLGGLRRCEGLGLRLGDIRPGERGLFIAEGKGGHQRIVPVSQRFFTSLASYLAAEVPAAALAEPLHPTRVARRVVAGTSSTDRPQALNPSDTDSRATTGGSCRLGSAEPRRRQQCRGGRMCEPAQRSTDPQPLNGDASN